MKEKILLKVENFSVEFKMYEKGLHQKISKAVEDLSLEVHKGEILAVVGSSGSGKSLLAHGILGILPENAIVGGKMFYQGEEMTPEWICKNRGKKISFVPQSISYLDPLRKMKQQIFEDTDISNKVDFLKDFSFREKDGEKYPFQLSGGMARRALVMTSILSNAELIIADEPTPGLNPKLAHEILAEFRKMANQGKGVLLITHDIDLVCEVADRVSIFYGGTILETTTVENFSKGGEYLSHPYSRALWAALPQNQFLPTEMEEIQKQCHAEGKIFPYNNTWEE